MQTSGTNYALNETWSAGLIKMGLYDDGYLNDNKISCDFKVKVDYELGANFDEYRTYIESVVDTNIPAIYSRCCFCIQDENARAIYENNGYYMKESAEIVLYGIRNNGTIDFTTNTSIIPVNNIRHSEKNGVQIVHQEKIRGGIQLNWVSGDINVNLAENGVRVSIECTANIPIFGTKADMYYYLSTGKMPTKSSLTWVMHTKTFLSDVTGDYGNFLYDDVTKIVGETYTGRKPVCGYVVKNNGYYNINIVIKEGYSTQSIEHRTNGELLNLNNPNHTYTTLIYDNTADAYYIGQILADTNIPIFRSEGDANAYINDTGNPEPVYDGGGSGSGENTTGDADAETTMNDTAENGTILSSVYVMTKEQLEAFGGVIYTDDTQVITAIKEGLALYGENPINFVVDCFYLPFDVSTFISTLPVSSIKFGSYVANLSGLKVTKNNTLTTLATVDIVGAYNDYRDYDFNYYLYLPYVGFTLLDIEMIIYKTLTIKAFFDVRTGNIKYYLFAGLNLIKTFEGNIRVSMPLASSDKVAQAGQYIKGIDSIVSGSMSTGMEIGSAIATKGASLAGGVGGGIPSIINGAMELQKGAPKSVSGNSSPSTAILDALYPYLIIEKPIYKNASSVRAEYNKPDMSVRKIGDTRGYGIFTDVMLETDADEEERNEILSLLSSGVIV